MCVAATISGDKRYDDSACALLNLAVFIHAERDTLVHSTTTYISLQNQADYSTSPFMTSTCCEHLGTFTLANCSIDRYFHLPSQHLMNRKVCSAKTSDYGYLHNCIIRPITCSTSGSTKTQAFRPSTVRLVYNSHASCRKCD